MPKRRQKDKEDSEAEYFVMPDYPLEMVLRDPLSGREVKLGITATLRDFEVLGSAGLHYAIEYANPDRPRHQVEARRERARRLGQALWEATVERVGVEEVPGAKP